MQRWLETEFTARPGPMMVYVSPVTGGWNFTNLDPVTPRLWAPAVEPPTSDYRRFLIVMSVFTEMDHNYVNGVTSRLGPDAYGFMTEANGWATTSAWSDYGSAELVANEYMTFAAYLIYAQERLDAATFVRIADATRRMMQGRGFVRFPAFADALIVARKSEPTALEALYPKVLAAVRV